MHSGLWSLHLPPIAVDLPVDKVRATACGPCFIRPGAGWLFYEPCSNETLLPEVLPMLCQAGHALDRFPFIGCYEPQGEHDVQHPVSYRRDRKSTRLNSS